MTYVARDIKDRVAVGDDVFIVEDLGNNKIKLTPAPTHVSEPGTPVNKALLQPIEDFLATLSKGGVTPPGGIIMWSGAINAIPEGWALCNGSNGTPDLRNKFVVGAGGSYGVGNTGGSNYVTLSESEMPQHRHGSGSLYTSTAGEHAHTYYRRNSQYQTNLSSGTAYLVSIASDSDYQTSRDGGHSHDVYGYTSYAGGGQSHENRPPYYALAYIMKL